MRQMVLKLDEIMVECTPIKLLPSQRKLPWLKKDIRSETKKRNTIFKKIGYNAKFRSARNRVIGICFAELKPTISKF